MFWTLSYMLRHVKTYVTWVICDLFDGACLATNPMGGMCQPEMANSSLSAWHQICLRPTNTILCAEWQFGIVQYIDIDTATWCKLATYGAYHLLNLLPIYPVIFQFNQVSLFASLLVGSCLGWIACSGILGSAKDVKGLWEELDRDGSGTIGIEDSLPANVLSQLNSMSYSVNCLSGNVTERAFRIFWLLPAEILRRNWTSVQQRSWRSSVAWTKGGRTAIIQQPKDRRNSGISNDV